MSKKLDIRQYYIAEMELTILKYFTCRANNKKEVERRAKEHIKLLEKYRDFGVVKKCKIIDIAGEFDE